MLPPTIVAVPFDGVVTEAIDRTSCVSESLSLASTSMVTASSSSVDALSLVATGLAFTLLTVTLTVATAVPPSPSSTWY